GLHGWSPCSGRVDLAVAQHLPHGRHQAGDRHLKFHIERDDLFSERDPAVSTEQDGPYVSMFLGGAPLLFSITLATNLHSRGNVILALGAAALWAFSAFRAVIVFRSTRHISALIVAAYSEGGRDVPDRRRRRAVGL
ncbi:MAG: hypothetical protein ACRDPK_04040, partial [Carbonactinosporaceae bacterium]